MALTLWIGLGVVVVSAALMIPALFTYPPEPATPATGNDRAVPAAYSGSRPPEPTSMRADVVNGRSRSVAALQLLCVVVGLGLGIAAVVGMAVLIASVALF